MSSHSFRYRGAGFIQLTWKVNYQMFADSIGDPRVMEGAFYVAANYPAYAATWWWKNNKMNKFVDRGNTVAQITKRVNGGYVKTLHPPPLPSCPLVHFRPFPG